MTSVADRIAELMPVAGATTAAIVFLTTYRTAELRALTADKHAKEWMYLREAIICTLLPALAGLLFAFAFDLALDALDELFGKNGFDAPAAVFVLFEVLLAVLLVYQVFLAAAAWKEWLKVRRHS